MASIISPVPPPSVLERAAADRFDDGSCALVALIQGSRLQLLQVGDCNALLLSTVTDAEGGSGAPADLAGVSAPTQHADGSAQAAAAPTHGSAQVGPARVRDRSLRCGELLCPAHRPLEPGEAKRLREAGVKVSAAGRIAGLAVSRAFGDRSHKLDLLPPGGLICVPDVVLRTLTTSDAFLVLACDGLWDFISAHDACSIVSECVAREGAQGAPYDSGVLEHAAKALVEAALDCGGTDNVSVIVVNVEGVPLT